MLDLMPEIQAWQQHGEQVAVATVVRVVGSAPRPVGARMVVSSSGQMAGSVSGGCVETAVFDELVDVLATGQPRKLHFGITGDMIWDVGLACGGTIDLFLQPLDPELVTTLAFCAEDGRSVALATFLSGPGQPGETLLIARDSVVFGQTHGQVSAHAQEMLSGRARGGRVVELGTGVEVYFEPFLPHPNLIIIGGVHVAIPLTRFAKELGFHVVVADPRAKFADRERFPHADEVLVEWPDEALAHSNVDESTFIVLLTHDPKIDEPTLASALKTRAAYIGAIGSRKTHSERFARMACLGITAEQLARVYAPIGLDLGAHSPVETALSIIGEIVAVKNGRSGASLRGGQGPIGNPQTQRVPETTEA